MESLDVHWRIFKEKGDEESFSIIYNHLIDKLFLYGISLGFEEEACKDAIQDVFYQLFIHKGRLEHIHNLAAYVFCSFRNRLIDLAKREQQQEPIENHKEEFATEETILDELISSEMERSIKKKVELMLSNLTDNQREIIYLKYKAGLSHKEIAKIMGINEESSRKQLYRALEKIRSISIL